MRKSVLILCILGFASLVLGSVLAIPSIRSKLPKYPASYSLSTHGAIMYPDEPSSQAAESQAPDLVIDRVRMPLYTIPEFHYIGVTVINNGTADAGPFNVSLAFYLSGVFQGMVKETLAGLPQGSNESILFGWEPSEYGTYTLITTVDCDDDVVELDETNNALTGSELCTFWGDADGDGDVDYNDFVVLAGAYGSKIGQPHYKSNCDFDHDGDVDFDDFLPLAGNFGRHI